MGFRREMCRFGELWRNPAGARRAQGKRDEGGRRCEEEQSGPDGGEEHCENEIMS